MTWNKSDHPQPQFAREEWLSLDGEWEFSFDGAARPDAVTWDRQIIVPYPPESPLSGIGDPGFHPIAWYRRSFELPAQWRGQRTLLHFGAVDYRATVWVNGQLVARHEGGHTPFVADITDSLLEGAQTVIVSAVDDPADMAQPRGKQDWLLEPHHIWYPRTTGIWQPVWIEQVAPTRISGLRMTPDFERFAVDFDVEIAGAHDGEVLDLELRLGEEILCADRCTVSHGRVRRTVSLPDPGIYSARDRYLWRPENPVLFDVALGLRRGGQVLDRLYSYTALRGVTARDRSFMLNGKPYFLRLVLDQGYWPQSHLAAPDGDALRRDVELAKAMGFNGVRKHQKVEDPRFLYWADRLGLLVWSEMPSVYKFSPEATGRLMREWAEVIERDRNHPCVVAWVPLNESWGVPDIESSSSQRHLAHLLYHLSKTLDDSRPVVSNDGWELVGGDLLTIHDYHREPEVLVERYGTHERVRATVAGTRPQNRRIVLEQGGLDDAPVILSEFGGIRHAPGATGWGYDEAESSDALLEKYRALVAAASSAGLAGFCYTQFADTFQEQNGLLYADRTPKADIPALAAATKVRG